MMLEWQIVPPPLVSRYRLDLRTLVAAVDNGRPVILTVSPDGTQKDAFAARVRRLCSLHGQPFLILPGRCRLDVRPIVLLHLQPQGRVYPPDLFARYHARTGRGTFISREAYERRSREACEDWRVTRETTGVEPIVRTFLEQLNNS